MKVAIIGRTKWLLESARRIAEVGHSIVFVATAKSQPEYAASEEDFASFAREIGAPFLLEPDANGDQFRARLRASRAEIGVSVNWPTLIRDKTCTAPPKGILNGHAGDLPRYRGNACPNWAILNNEPYVGLCVHAMDPDAVDAGPVFARSRLRLTEEVYIDDVYRWIDDALPALFVDALKRTTEPNFVPESQSGATEPLRCHPRRPEDGRIDWQRAAEEICRLVRASSRPLQGAFAYLDGGARVTIWRARPCRPFAFAAIPGQIMGRSASGGVLVACGSGAIEVEEASVEGGAELPGANRYRLHTNAL